MALQVYEDDLCNGCGKPMTYSADNDSRGRWVHKHITCHACATLDRQTPENPSPGRREYVVPDGPLAHAMRHPLPQQT